MKPLVLAPGTSVFASWTGFAGTPRPPGPGNAQRRAQDHQDHPSGQHQQEHRPFAYAGYPSSRILTRNMVGQSLPVRKKRSLLS
jgi:hypothetical protein